MRPGRLCALAHAEPGGRVAQVADQALDEALAVAALERDLVIADDHAGHPGGIARASEEANRRGIRVDDAAC